jgi:hypothetical protein
VNTSGLRLSIVTKSSYAEERLLASYFFFYLQLKLLKLRIAVCFDAYFVFYLFGPPHAHPKKIKGVLYSKTFYW